MSTGIKILIGIISMFLIIGISSCGMIVGVNNTCVKHEAGIKAQYKQNKNNYDNYFKKLKEAVQIPEMYAADLKKLYDGVMGGRYGSGGSKATWQWIKEHNPKLDPSMYIKIQSMIESGRTDFETNQKMLLDKKRIYEDEYLKTFPSGFVAGLLSFPKMDLVSMDIITSDKTEKIFEAKKSGFIKLK